MPSTRMSRRRKQSSDVISRYGGPIRIPTYDGQDSVTLRVNLTNTYSLNSDGSGNIAAYWTPGSVSSSTDWSSYAATYQEFRVLGMQLHYVPFYNGTYNSTVKPTVGAIATVHIPLGSTPASVDEVTQHTTWKSLKTSATLNQDWRMYGIEESVFTPTASPTGANHGGIVLYVDTATASVRYGSVFLTFLVEFRGRQ